MGVIHRFGRGPSPPGGNGPNLPGMKIFKKIAQALQGVEFLREVWQERKLHPDLVREWSRLYGFSETAVAEWVHAAKNWGHYSDKEVLAKAEKLSVAKLVLISKAMNNVAKPEREKLRVALVDIAGPLTWQELKARAGIMAKELRQPKTNSTVTVSKVADAQGMKHAHVRLKEEVMDAFVDKLKRVSQSPPGTDEAAVLGAGLERLIEEGGGPGEKRALEPAFITALPGTKYVGDGKYATTDGRIIDGADIIKEQLSSLGWVVIYDGTNHIGDCYRLENERFASDTLRKAIDIYQIYCAHPGCTQPATHFEYHHTIAYKDGGKTNALTIIGLCVNHNRQNDDDPGHVKNGRHIRDDHGRAGWIPPEGGPILYNQLPATDYNGHAIAAKILAAEAAATAA